MRKLFASLFGVWLISMILVACDSPTPPTASPRAAHPQQTTPSQTSSGAAASQQTSPTPAATTAPQTFSASSTESPSADSATTPPTPKRTLLFFKNPAGVPCQMQERILAELGSRLTDQVNIISVSTDVPSDRPVFGHYGIRALPTLVLLDSQQNEIRRFPPGIQNGEYLLQILSGEAR